MAQIKIDLSGRGGLVERYFGETASNTTAPQLRYIAKDGQVALGGYNPSRKYGYMSQPTDSYETLTASGGAGNINEFTCSVYDSANALGFWGEKNTDIFQDPVATSNAFVNEATIAGAVFTDLEIYQVNGAKKLFYAYQKAGGGNIGISNIPWGTNNNTWLSGTVSGAFNTGAFNDVFMIPSDNGYLYVADGNTLHKLDGTSAGGANGTATSNVLVFPFGLTLTDGVDYRGRAWLAIQSSSTVGNSDTGAYNARICGIYVWDRQTTQVNMTDFIPLPGVREIRRIFIGPAGDLRIICLSDTRMVQIRKFNGSYWGSTFDVVAELGFNSYPRYRDSVTQVGPLSIWLGNDAKWWAFGALTVQDKEALYCLGDASTLGASLTPGAVLAAGANFSVLKQDQAIEFVVQDGSSRFVRRWWLNSSTNVSSNTTVTAIGQAQDIFYPQMFLPRMSTINWIAVHGAPTSTTNGTTIGTLNAYTNQATTSPFTQTITDTAMNKGYMFWEWGLPYVNALQLSFNFPGKNLGADDFLPAYAIIDYTPTNTNA